MIHNFLVKFITLLNLAALLLIGWFLFHPVELTQIHNIPYPVTPNQVEPGGTITYPVIFEKFENYKVKTTRTLTCESGLYRSLSNSVTEAPIGYHEILGETEIPEDMPPGRCYIQFNSDAQINPIRVESIDSRTEWFDIL